MAQIINSRNKLLNEAATRILGANVYITSGTSSSLTVPANSNFTVPGTIILTAVPSRYVAPQYSWSYRFGDSGSFISINNSNTNTITVNGDSTFVSAASGFNIVQYKVDVIETAAQGTNPSSFTLTIPILRQGVNSVLGVLSNESQAVYADAEGSVPAGTVIQSTLYIYNGTTDDSANWSASISASTGIAAELINGKTISVSLPVNTPNGYVDITATRQGYPNIVKRFNISKILEGVPGIPGTNGVDGTTYYTWVKYGSYLLQWSGNQAWPASSTISNASTYTFESTYAEPVRISLYLLDAEGGVQVALNGTQIGTNLRGNDNEQKWYYLDAQAVVGTNEIKIWSTNTDGGSVQKIDVFSVSDYPDGKTHLGIAYNKSSPVESTVYNDYYWSLIKGSDGIPGQDGIDGQTTYTWIKYADNASGLNMSDSSTGKTYIGIAVNKTTSIESSEASEYTWSLIKGTDGSDGVSPTSYEVSAVSPVINRSASNTLTPSTLVVNAYSTVGDTKSAYSGRFRIYEDGTLRYTSSTDQSTYTYTPVAPTTVSLFKVELYQAGGTTTLLDAQEIPVTVSGSSGITISISNTAFTAPADSSGAVSTYAGSGTTIQVFEGSTALTYRTTLGTNVSSFTIGTPTLSVANAITVGARSGDGTTTATVANHSAMSNSVSAVVISYPITYNRANGAQATQIVTQTITKALAGSIGVRGSRQIFDTNSAYTSTYDFDGGGTILPGADSYAARATQLVATVTAGLNPTTPINGDTVTFTNGTDYVYTITHNGTSWVPPGTIIDGSLLVTGSVTASKINSNGLDIRDSSGNVILSSGSTLGAQVATTYGGGNLCQNSGFDAGTLDKWSGASGIDLNADWMPHGGHAAYAVQTSGTAYMEIMSANMPVKAGQRYEYHGKTGAHRCNVAVFIYWFNSANNIVGNTPLIYNLQEAVGGPSLNTWKHHGGFGVAPAGAVAARFVFRKDTTAAGYTDSYMFATQAYFGEAGANQTTFTPWAPSVGGGRFGALDQITPGNASTYIASAAIGAAQIGSISLVGTNNFNVKSATTGQRMEMDSRVIKIFDASGVLRVQIGDLTL